MTKFKKSISVILSSAVAIVFSSCSFSFEEKEPEKPKAEIVLGYIQEKNTDAIYDLLCEKLQNTPNINEQIEQTFDFIDGEIISYEINNSSSNAQWGGGKSKINLYSSCKQIKTHLNKEYQLIISYYDVNDFEPELVGIDYIAIVEKDQDGNGFLKKTTIE